jgi:electron transfer flavoprotein alpha subunit
MAILVIAEHDNANIKPATLNTVGAAAKIGGEIHVLVAGSNCAAAAQAAAKISGVTKILLADAAELAHQLPEDSTPIIVDLAKNYTHILAPATTFGKNLLPRTAALLDVQQISEITAVDSPDTFQSVLDLCRQRSSPPCAPPIRIKGHHRARHRLRPRSPRPAPP